MRLAAIATAAGVPDGGFAGTVEHVYPRVCLLGLADQTLVTLATSAVGHLPRALESCAFRQALFRSICVARTAGNATSPD